MTTGVAAISGVTVVVPAKDEQDVIGACLDALCTARARLLAARPQIGCRIVVVLDDCHDATAAVVSGYPDVEVRTSVAASVGAARRVGAAGIAASASHWIASTDADCEVPEDWLLLMLEHAGRGADAVLGTVRPVGLRSSLREAWLTRHELGDGHRHVHGANLGVRADVYAAVGGWAALTVHEDVDLVARVERAGGSIDRCGDIVVRTSSRTDGRVPAGFAGYLRDLEVDVGRTLGRDVTDGLSGASAG